MSDIHPMSVQQESGIDRLRERVAALTAERDRLLALLRVDNEYFQQMTLAALESLRGTTKEGRKHRMSELWEKRCELAAALEPTGEAEGKSKINHNDTKDTKR